MILQGGVARIRGYGQPAQEIAGLLGGQVGRRVVDGAGLKGKWDFTLEFSTAASAGLPPPARANDPTAQESVPGVTVFGAAQQQLGLRLESTKQMVDIFVVDSADKVPSQN
jgi:uncharacterized protein (TIGR03435 family)